jgi:hypothetical protein
LLKRRRQNRVREEAAKGVVPTPIVTEEGAHPSSFKGDAYEEVKIHGRPGSNAYYLDTVFCIG